MVSLAAPSGHELLPAVDVVGRAGEGGVGHDVNGERGDVGRSDDAPDGSVARSWSRRSSSSSPSSDADNGVSTKPAAMRLTRTGASSSARLAVSGGQRGGDRRSDPEADGRCGGRRCRP